MNDYIISCCSTVDLTPEHLNNLGIPYLCCPYYLDDKPYKDDLGVSMPSKDFYQALRNGSDPRTSQVTEEDFTEFFGKIQKEHPGKDIFHVSFSSGLSGTCQNAMAAAKKINETNPQSRIVVVDSLAASSGYGLMVDKCAELRGKGMDIDTLAKWVEDNRLKLHHWFFSTDLTFYIKGGRVSKTSGFVAGLLGICPLLNVNEEGKLIPREKIISKRRVKEALIKKVALYIDDGENYTDKIYMCNSDCFEDAQDVKNVLETIYTKKNGEVEINNIGTVIGSHSGPGTVAVFFWGKDRTTIL